MKIKSENTAGQAYELFVPYDGMITVNEDGVADVSPKCAAALVKLTSSWEYVKETEEVEEETETSETDNAEMREKLSAMTLADMKSMAAEAELPESDYSKITKKKDMVEYLLGALDFSGEDEVEETEEVEEETEE